MKLSMYLRKKSGILGRSENKKASFENSGQSDYWAPAWTKLFQKLILFYTRDKSHGDIDGKKLNFQLPKVTILKVEDRDKSELVATFGTFGLSTLRTKEKVTGCSWDCSSAKRWQLPIEILMENIRPVNTQQALNFDMNHY